MFVPDALGPEVLVETDVHSDVRGAHHLLGKLANLLDGTRGPLLEATVHSNTNINVNNMTRKTANLISNCSVVPRLKGEE